MVLHCECDIFTDIHGLRKLNAKPLLTFIHEICMVLGTYLLIILQLYACVDLQRQETQEQQQQRSPVVTYAPPASEPPQPTVILQPTASVESQDQIRAPNERLSDFDKNISSNNSGRCRVRSNSGVVKGAAGTDSKSSQTVGRRCSSRIKARERCDDIRNMVLHNARRHQRRRHRYNELRYFVPMNFRSESPDVEIEELVARVDE